MPDVNYPLSGDVTQTLNPWSIFTRGQFGLFNINMGESSDPELEKRIVATVGSYGRQLGHMGEALLFLINQLTEKKQLDPTDDKDKVIEAFKNDVDAILSIKKIRH